MTGSTKQRTVWLTGSRGQLGQALLQHHEQWIHWVPTGREQVDLRDLQAVRAFFESLLPDVVLNAAAFTQVDEAERNEAEADRLNADAPRLLAELCRTYDKVLIHVSTDHVFDGSGTEPYTEQDKPHPINAYGKSKLKGEEAVLKSGAKAYLFRTSWLYAPHGQNFYRTIRHLSAERDQIEVVEDEVGSPTSALDFADFLMEVVGTLGTERQLDPGLYHYANTGSVSRYRFAQSIATLEPGTARCSIRPTTQAAYGAIAKRPAYASLATDRIAAWSPHHLRPWHDALIAVHEQTERQKRNHNHGNR